MTTSSIEFRTGSIRPFVCLKSGWHLIREQYWLFLAITFVGIVLGSIVPMGIILGPMMCGIHLCFFQKLRGGRVSFDILFKGFDFFAQSLIAMLIMLIPSLIMMVPVYLVFGVRLFKLMERVPQGPGVRPEDLVPFFQGYFAILIQMFGVIFPLSIIIGAFFIFTFPLIVDRGLSGVDAVKTSVRAALGNLGGLLGLLFITMVMGIVGMSCCYVGAIFLMPISFAAFVIAYCQVFGKMG